MAKEVKASSALGSVTRSSSESNGQWQVGLESRPRLTAQALAKAQRDISVSEFFAKNRHLLGFDNPRKALLTTVKEAVDNALDACEEAGILPEVWVKIEEVGPNRFRVAVQDNGPGILKKQIPLIFGKLLYGSKFHRLRMSRGQQGIGISAAGMYGLLTTRETGVDYFEDRPRQAGPLLRGADRHQAEPSPTSMAGAKGVDIPPGDAGARWMARGIGIEWIDVPHGTRRNDRAGGAVSAWPGKCG